MYLCGNRYKVLGRLGGGGFGNVYLAEDQFLKKTWALKDIGSINDISYTLVRAEVSVLTKVSHPGIVRITDVFISNDHIFIVMDHIRGMNLEELLGSGRRLSGHMLHKWSMELCDAVSYLHHMQPPVILCDIKPQNIMVKPDGHIVLIDFGAAIPCAPAETAESFSFATRKYASPEQLQGKKPVIKSDIYSLGKVLDRLYGRDKPFGLSFVIKRCTMKDPVFRFGSVRAVQRALILSASLTRILICLILLLTAGCLILSKAGEKARLINESARAAQAYEQGLMCFYELDDYEAAKRYLSEVPSEDYPEAAYYIEISDLIMSDGTDEKLDEVLKSFEAFNEREIFPAGTDRYMKNSFCIARIYMSYDMKDSRYEDACSILSHILTLCRADPEEEKKDLQQYEGDALRMLINLLILQGRSDEELMSKSYHEAIGYIEELTALDESHDDRTLISGYMDEAALYTELGEYDNALRIYDRAEERFPLAPEIKYFSHLSLLMQSDASEDEILSLWKRIVQVPGIEQDEGFEKMKERMEGYLTDS